MLQCIYIYFVILYWQYTVQVSSRRLVFVGADLRQIAISNRCFGVPGFLALWSLLIILAETTLVSAVWRGDSLSESLQSDEATWSSCMGFVKARDREGVTLQDCEEGAGTEWSGLSEDGTRLKDAMDRLEDRGSSFCVVLASSFRGAEQ